MRIADLIWKCLAYTRVPGNAFSFWIRRTLHWSRGLPTLEDEPKDGLFAYLDAEATAHGTRPAGPEAGRPASDAPSATSREAEDRERALRERYDLAPLRSASTLGLYRKTLYLLDILERSSQGLDLPPRGERELRAVDVGAQDWHYVFGLERWLSRGSGTRRSVSLRGIEVDGYGIYPDLRSRCDYARAYAGQTGNPAVVYEVADFLDVKSPDLDVITWFYPFVTRPHLLLWGLPLRYYRPERMVAKAAALLRPGGWLVVLAHTGAEHEAFLALAKSQDRLELIRAGEARSPLVDFHAEVADRRFSIWRRK